MKYRNALRIAPFLLTLGVLTVLAVKPTPTTLLYPGADKLYHLIAFAALTFTAHRAFPRAALGSLFAWILAAGAFIELLQLLSPGRTASIADMTANLMGVLTGLVAIQLTRSPHRQPRSPEIRTRRRTSSGKKRQRSTDKPRHDAVH